MNIVSGRGCVIRGGEENVAHIDLSTEEGRRLAARMAAIKFLPPRPPWWRPFALARWRSAVRATLPR